MVSSVVGFYSSPLFMGLLPRAQDTNLTEVADRLLHVSYLAVRFNQKLKGDCLPLIAYNI